MKIFRLEAELFHEAGRKDMIKLTVVFSILPPPPKN